MASPKPKPAALKLIEGRGPGVDSGGRPVKQPPKFDREAPIAPAELPSGAREVWDHVVPELHRLGILKAIDQAALEAYCMAVHRFREANAIVEREGMIRDGFKHPAVAIAEVASRELRAWAGEFGLTPSSENRLASAKGDDGNQGNPFAAPALRVAK